MPIGKDTKRGWKKMSLKWSGELSNAIQIVRVKNSNTMLREIISLSAILQEADDDEVRKIGGEIKDLAKKMIS